MELSDRPVHERQADLLGRWGLARTVFELIRDSRDSSALRIGIYGGWGEGKTSVLRLVEAQARSAEIPVCWFSVWAADSQIALWSNLVDALRSLPGGSDSTSWLKTRVASLLSKTKDIAETNAVGRTAHALGRLVSHSAQIGAKDAERVIANVAKKQRVIILVDDVDRVEAELVPKLLMGLHELFEGLQGCAVIVALDPDAVSGALSRVNPAWASAPAFLGKIVQYPFWLSQPDDGQMNRLLREALMESRLAVPEQSVLDLAGGSVPSLVEKRLGATPLRNES